eukprot:TRINITY_DN14210_c0_g1_i3.p1 TRINITY_DN14210_c0_g1~~TRINITY_DN14210_c0_g1_i3.p1  ORF type:complete len:659 (-),score=64.24 TRINITY_DN14210_c0_g1_i3:138-2114(-)
MTSPSDGISLSAAQKRKARLRRTAIAKAAQCDRPDQGKTNDVAREHTSTWHAGSARNEAGHIQEQLNHLRQMFCCGLDLLDSLQRHLMAHNDEQLHAPDCTPMPGMGQQSDTPDFALHPAHFRASGEVAVIVGSALRADARPFIPRAAASCSDTMANVLEHLSRPQKQGGAEKVAHQWSSPAVDCTSLVGETPAAIDAPDITPTRSCVAIAINEFYDVACEVRQRLPHIPCDYSIKWSRAPPLLLHQCMLTDTLPNPDNLDEASSAVTPVGLPLGLVGVSMASLLNQSCTVAFRDAPAISDVPDRAPTRSRSAITVNEFYGVAREVRKRLPYISCHYSIKWSRTPPLLLHQCMLTDTPPRHARLTGVLGDARHAEGSPIQMLQHVAQPSCRLSRARDVLEQLAESQPILRDCCIIVNDFGIIYAENKAPYVRTSSQALQGFACVCTSTLALAVLSGGDEEPPFVTCASCRRHAGGQVILRLMTTEAPTLQNFVGDWEDSNGFQAKVAYPCWYIGRRRRKYLNVALMGSSMQRTMQLREDSSRFLCGPAYLDLDCYSPDLLRWIFPDGSDCYWRRCKSDTTPKTAEVIPENQSQLPDKFPVGCQRRTPRRQSQTSVTTRIHAGGTRRRKGKTKRPKTSCRSRHTGPMPAAARGDRSVKS